MKKDDGFSYIVGCQYVIHNPPSDLARWAYLVVNETQKVKLDGKSKKLNKTTFQLPEHIFIVPATYRCLIEAKELYNESAYSESSTYIPMPGIVIYYSIKPKIFAKRPVRLRISTVHLFYCKF